VFYSDRGGYIKKILTSQGSYQFHRVRRDFVEFFDAVSLWMAVLNIILWRVSLFEFGGRDCRKATVPNHNCITWIQFYDGCAVWSLLIVTHCLRGRLNLGGGVEGCSINIVDVGVVCSPFYSPFCVFGIKLFQEQFFFRKFPGWFSGLSLCGIPTFVQSSCIGNALFGRFQSIYYKRDIPFWITKRVRYTIKYKQFLCFFFFLYLFRFSPDIKKITRWNIVKS